MVKISIKDAVKSAKEKLQELYQDDKPRDLALEEIELTKYGDNEVWAVTLGFLRIRSVRQVSNPVLTDIFKPPQQVENRVYKTMLIDASTGEFVKMEMRQV